MSSIQYVLTPTPHTPGCGGLPCSLTTAFCCGGLKLSRAHLQLTKGISVGSQLLPRPRAGLCGFVSACYGGKVTDGTLLNCPGSQSFLFFSAPLLLPTFLFKTPKAKVIPVKTPFGFWPLPKVPSPQSLAFTSGPRIVLSSK